MHPPDLGGRVDENAARTPSNEPLRRGGSATDVEWLSSRVDAAGSSATGSECPRTSAQRTYEWREMVPTRPRRRWRRQGRGAVGRFGGGRRARAQRVGETATAARRARRAEMRTTRNMENGSRKGGELRGPVASPCSALSLLQRGAQASGSEAHGSLDEGEGLSVAVGGAHGKGCTAAVRAELCQCVVRSS